MIPVIIGIVALADFVLDVTTGVSVTEFVTGYDVTGTVLNAVGDVLGIPHNDFTAPGGLLVDDVPTLPEIINGEGSSFLDDVNMEQIGTWFTDLWSGIDLGFLAVVERLDMWGQLLLIAIVIVGIVALVAALNSMKTNKILRRSKR